ncbi:hypothetical protein CRG98_037584 [Punica granatum]|uniref:BHLH domain-containing protein n=1 Tax=Punica granatum TaxID=22663 RepID=A0A2I0IDE3_PUNGR|nr:hypothetical protein CRG98_037584 [Punica granatum]
MEIPLNKRNGGGGDGGGSVGGYHLSIEFADRSKTQIILDPNAILFCYGLQREAGDEEDKKRRDKINQRMKTLQKLVPNSSKTDKASVLDEVIEYLKQLQAQVQMMSRMNMKPMMLPMAMQQQLQMSMMAPMGLGMGMGMGMPGVMDMNALTGRPNLPGMPPNGSAPILHPAAAAAPFLPLAPLWDGSGCNGDRLHPSSTAAAPVLADPFAAFLACQSQPMTLDAYSRMAAIYQQLHQPPASSSKN